MYQFKITKQDNGGFRFELSGIKLLVEDYYLENGRHFLRSPQKAIAYFNLNNNLYGISNAPLNYDSVESFFDAMVSQYQLISR